ncbi:MAG: S-methyl-5-thioribose kinase [Betaproteobacteria bacterium AqS2]|uniref:S-methyl-5-thioribose kinase n=1 Tax=Candidatus Amphirhobacter heronislandensis TaxID=1732024 RepID=A0A930UEX7_9GAMM|nr:S-methyl-5-thioribose kinase [Betaproteobacteria bacterium AqS2]
MTVDQFAIPEGYAPFDADSLRAWLAGRDACAGRLGGKPEQWDIAEIGDGNLNYVFIAKGPEGSLCVKQALPYLRMVGESWPLTLRRAHFERMALQVQAKIAPALVPAVLDGDETLCCTVQEDLSDHIIIRKGMVHDARVYPRFAADIAEYMARCLFMTSDLHLPLPRKWELAGDFFGNHNLASITHTIMFNDPYVESANNHWNEPYINGYARRLREDVELRRASNRLKTMFLTEAQALIHCDLHTGSIMVTEDSTKVIDPEFAFCGPMAFDTGKLLGNLLINYFSHSGWEDEPGGRDSYRRWVLDTSKAVWEKFEAGFLALWRDPAVAVGDGYPAVLYADAAGKAELERAQHEYMAKLYRDTLAYAGLFMIRRLVGIAHNIDTKLIEDPRRRARCEGRGLQLGIELLGGPEGFASLDAVAARAEQIEGAEPALTEE